MKPLLKKTRSATADEPDSKPIVGLARASFSAGGFAQAPFYKPFQSCDDGTASRRRSTVFASDVGDGCYRVEDGLLKVTMVSRSGGERILAFLGPGEIVGELSVIDSRPRSASVVAVQNVALSFLSSTNFENFARKHPEIYKFLVILLAARLRETDVAIAAATFLPMGGRLACALIELAHHFGEDVGFGRIVIQQKVGQADLAAMAGIARESVNRILNDWKRRKLVSRRDGYYRIENKARLENEAEL